MDDFFKTSDGEDLTKNKEGSYDAGGGGFDPIPAKTQVLAAIDEISWDQTGDFDDYPGEDIIKARWSILSPPEFKNRKVFQKIRPLCEDAKKADKGKKMFSAIDANAGGKLAKLGKLPDDVALQGLTGKPQVLMLQVWQIKDGSGNVTNEGNWVSSVSPRKSGAAKAAAANTEAEAEPAQSAQEKPAIDNFDDDIPF